MCKTIFHSESVFFFFLRGLCSSLGLCFSVGFASLLELGYYSWLGRCSLLLLIQTNTWTSFFTQNLFFTWICFFTQTQFFTETLFFTQICFSLRSVLHSLCFPLSICSSLKPWSSIEFGSSFGWYFSIRDYSSFRSFSSFGHLCSLFFIQILLFIKTSLKQILLTAFNPNEEKNTSLYESHWFSIDFSLFNWIHYQSWFFFILSTAAHAFIHDLQLALN